MSVFDVGEVVMALVLVFKPVKKNQSERERKDFRTKSR